MMFSKSPIVYAVAAVLLWSTVATAFKLGLERLAVPQLLLCSSLFSAVGLGVYLLATKKSPIRNIYKTDFLFFALIGLLNPAIYYLALFRAYDILPAQQALTLNYTWAVFLSLFSVIFGREKFSILKGIALLLGLAGVAVIASKGNLSGFNIINIEGAGLALFSAVVWASYWMLNRNSKVESEVKLFWCFLFGSVYLIIFNLLFFEISIPALGDFIYPLYIGLFEMGITFLLWNKALNWSTNTALLGNLVFISPFLSLFIINIVLGEKILDSTVIGLVFIIFGIILQTRAHKKEI